MISTRLVELVIDTVVCLTLVKWETVAGQFGDSRYSRLSSKNLYRSDPEGALTCPRWPASPAQRQLSDWYRCPVAMVMVLRSERCPVVIPARASPAERQLSDWYRCPVAMLRCPVAMVISAQA